MALFKPSKKTQKAVSQGTTSTAETKTPVAGANARSAKTTKTVPVKAAAEAKPATHKKAEAFSAVTKTPTAVVYEATPKTMAAAAGHSMSAASTTASATSNGNHNGGSRPTREAIAKLAYCFWADRHFAHGSAEEDWARAEAELSK